MLKARRRAKVDLIHQRGPLELRTTESWQNIFEFSNKISIWCVRSPYVQTHFRWNSTMNKIRLDCIQNGVTLKHKVYWEGSVRGWKPAKKAQIHGELKRWNWHIFNTFQQEGSWPWWKRTIFVCWRGKGFLIMRNIFIGLNTGSKISQGSLPLFALNPCSEYLSNDAWLCGCLILGRERLWIWVTIP